MKRNPFKKQSIMDTLTNVGIGGASNVLFDYVWKSANLDATFTPKDTTKDSAISADTIKNGIKVAGGVIVGGMIKNKYGRAAADGIATVGVSNLVASLMESDKESDEGGDTAGNSGLPTNTIGRISRRYGSAAYARRARGTHGTSGLDGFMG